ncbi:ATP-grasp fold amidoligase family protein [Parvibaculum sp.]|uniref:ATP-grasp fold amidoligase family protein n=1 Tax=Parvibaculum sp. TaxID=2024848 RepID=UPI00320D8B29
MPETYYDWMQWRKLVDHNPLFVTLGDKLKARDYVAQRIPALMLPRLLWAGDGSAAIPEDVLRSNVVVKTSNGSNRNFFIRDGKYAPDELSRTLKRWRAEGPYERRLGEWAYGQIERRIFVEELLPCSTGPLIDIAIRAGGGQVAFGSLVLHTKTDRESTIYLSREGERLSVECGAGISEADLDAVPVPEGYAAAVAHAAHLSRNIDYARFDFLWSDGALYGGEITVYPGSGIDLLHLQTHRRETTPMSVWDVRKSWFLSTPQPGWRGVYREMLLDELDRRGWIAVP